MRLPTTLFFFFLLALTGSVAQPTGQLRVKILDGESKRPTPVRVRVTRMGKPIATPPSAAIAVSYGLWDHADGFAFQPDSSFYVAGTFSIKLRPGTYQIALSKGNEYLRQLHSVFIEPGKVYQKTYRMNRWINMAAHHWYSADNHIHIRRSPNENQALLDWLRGEDINVGVFLKMGDFWATYYPQYAFGDDGVYKRGNYLLTSGQEDPRTPELGHALGFGASGAVRYGLNYYYYDKVFDELHRRGGLTGYAHQAKTFHGYRGLTLDGLRGKVDVLEILQYCVSSNPLHTEQYYRMLDLGFPMTATAGSDFPWCGHDHDKGLPEKSAQIGNARFYTYVQEPFSVGTWQKNVVAGHTFVSSGPLLDFRVNKSLPGDRVEIERGDALTIAVDAYGHVRQVPLTILELVSHGKVLSRVTSQDADQSSTHLSIRFKLDNVQQGTWLAARAFGDSAQAAHTTPIYVTIGNEGFHNPATALMYLRQSEDHLQELEGELESHREDPEYRAWYYKKGLKMRISETKEVIDSLKKRLVKP